jgi:hypothetical protein
MYEPTPNGRPRLIGADYLVLADMWNAQHPECSPHLMGQLFHLKSTDLGAGMAFTTMRERD